jgi:hypothetical protein
MKENGWILDEYKGGGYYWMKANEWFLDENKGANIG